MSHGWFQLGSSQANSIVEDLHKHGILKLKFTEGSLDNEKYGRQLFELGKQLFETINKQATAGEGFFRFEPIQRPPDSGVTAMFFGAFGWSVSVNVGYSERHFAQEIKFQETISYTGRIKKYIPVGMTLAVFCNHATSKYFMELGVTEPCVTVEKLNSFTNRINHEIKAKQPLLKNLARQYDLGKISRQQYEQKRAKVMTTSVLEDLDTIELADKGSRSIFAHPVLAGASVTDEP